MMNRYPPPKQYATQDSLYYPDFLTELAMHDRQVRKLLALYQQATDKANTTDVAENANPNPSHFQSAKAV